MQVVPIQDEFHELEQKAMALLAEPQALEPRRVLQGYRPEFRLWDYPSLDACRCWTIFLPLPVWAMAMGNRSVGEAREVAEVGEVAEAVPALPVVREALWDRRRDAWRLGDSMERLAFRFGFNPTIHVSDATLPPAQWRQQLAALERLDLPLQPAKPAGGPYAEFFGLESGISFKGAGVQWWCGQSLAWEELADWFGEMRRFLLQCLDPI